MSGTGPPPGTGLPPPGWENAILASVGAPATTANIDYFNVWAAAEHGAATEAWGGPDEGGAFNPFDTSLPEPGSTDYNHFAGGGGVQSYGSWPAGLRATASTLEQTNMSPLLAALRSGADTVAELETAEAATPWGQEPGWPAVGTSVPTATSGGLGGVGNDLLGALGIGVGLGGGPGAAGLAVTSPPVAHALGSAASNAAGHLAGGFWSGLGSILLTVAGVSAGLALVVLGAWKTTAREHPSAGSIAGIATVAA